MKEPGFLFYSGLIFTCLLLVLAGVYLLAKFNTLFKNTIKNETLRKNAVVWLLIFCLNGALSPMGGGFFLILFKFGWWGMLLGHLVSTTANTVFTYNAARYVADHKIAKQLSFFRHKLLVVVVVTIMTLLVNVPFAYCIYSEKEAEYIKYSYISSIYFGATTGLIYTLLSYLELGRKRKFDEKELELSRLRELKTKAELDALHSKINPHFLYNALNSIADLSVTDGKKGRRMTIALADLFRYSINYTNNNYSTVKEEVEMADAYLQIEKIRFEDQLNYSLNVEEDMNHYLVPRFVLQPLVENAVKHGLKATGRMTEIKLEVKKKNEGLVIVIADTGPAFPDELVPGYGVKSVYDKLDLLFPGNYEMYFSNTPVKQVSIHIHKLAKDESAV